MINLVPGKLYKVTAHISAYDGVVDRFFDLVPDKFVMFIESKDCGGDAGSYIDHEFLFGERRLTVCILKEIEQDIVDQSLEGPL